MSTSAHRRFSAIVDSEGVYLAEIARAKDGFRIIGEWSDHTASSTATQAAQRLGALVRTQPFRRATVSVALHHFESFHHVMALPAANDAVIRPIINREVQRQFGVADAVVAYTPGVIAERRSGARADIRTAPRQYIIGGAPRATVQAIADEFADGAIEIDGLTVVPEALRRMYAATSPSLEPTAVLVCLHGGPQLAFFLDGRLELAIDPPVALEDEGLSSTGTVLAQFERGAVYFRQQFRGAEATQLLLAAPAAVQDALSHALHERFEIRVRPLMPHIASPEAVIAIGAMLETQSEHPLDLFPHAPSSVDRLRDALRGPKGLVAAGSTVAAAAALWAALGGVQVATTKRDINRLQNEVDRSSVEIGPLRNAAAARASAAQTSSILHTAGSEARALSAQLASLAGAAPAGLSFDSLRVDRKQSSWAGMVSGHVAALTSADGLRAVNSFYRELRVRQGFLSPVLDQFDYPPGTDSMSAHGPVVIQFHVSFSMQPDQGLR